MATFDIITIVLISIIAILIGFMVWIFLTEMSNTSIYNKKRKKMDIALENILGTYYRKKDYENSIQEIKLVYNDVVISNDYLKNEMPNIVTLLEDHVLRINAEDVVLRDSKIDVDVYKKSVQELISEYNRRNPLEQIKGTDYVVLKQLIDHLERAEVEEGKEVINKVAEELKGLQDNILEREKNSRKQDAMTKVSIGLTVVFGAMTVIQFFV